MPAIQPDPHQLREFFDAVFPASITAGKLFLRTFVDVPGGKPAVETDAVNLDQPRRDVLNQVWTAVQAAANHPSPTVFCPPVAVFKSEATRAREDDLAGATALAVDLDQNPARGRAALTRILGEPTLTVASGGVEIDDLGIPSLKLHLYWVLSEPARSEGDGLAKLKECRRMAKALAGGDHTNVPVVHPIRWPGSLHRKDPKNPRLCRILHNTRARFALASLHAQLKQALPADHPAANALQPGQRVDDRQTAEIVRSLVAGEALHPNLVPLAMRFANAHVPERLALDILRGMMLGAPLAQDDRFRARYDDLARTIRSAYARQQFETDPDWINRLRDHRGQLRGDWNTIWQAIRTAPPLRHAFRWDERGGRIVIAAPTPWDAQLQQPRALIDKDITALCIYLNAAGIPLEGDGIPMKTLTAHAQTQSYDPVADYLQSLKWDGVPRADDWLLTYCGAQTGEPFSPEYVRSVGAKWLIQCCARAFRPGCKADCVLILEGQQGAYKSEAFKILGGEWFSDRMGDLGGDYRSAAEVIQGAWIVEIAELDAMRKADVSRVKDFITKQEDIYRAPYGKVAERRPRRCSFGGTINPVGDMTYLQDPSGNRRFWPVYVNGVHRGQIDRQALQGARDQLWAEAVHRYRAGESWWFDRDDERQLVSPVQEARALEETWTQPLADWLNGQDAADAVNRGYTVSEILSGALSIPPERQSRAAQTRAGIALAAVPGWAKRRVSGGVSRTNRYYRASTPEGAKP